MGADREDHTGQVPLPGFGEPGPGGGQVPLPAGRPSPPGPGEPGRGDSIRRIRRMSNWTLAALIVGTGAATVALAHNALPSSTTVAGTTATTAGPGAGATAATHGGPQVSHSVATTSGSGVVVTTTTRTANGKIIVTRVRHSAHHDN